MFVLGCFNKIALSEWLTQETYFPKTSEVWDFKIKVVPGFDSCGRRGETLSLHHRQPPPCCSALTRGSVCAPGITLETHLFLEGYQSNWVKIHPIGLCSSESPF